MVLYNRKGKCINVIFMLLIEFCPKAYHLKFDANPNS